MSRATRAAYGLILTSLVATATAVAQGTRAQFGVGASVTVPTGDYHADAAGDGFKVGWQTMALLDVRPSGSPLGFRVDAAYGQNSGNDKFNADVSAAAGAPATGRTRLLGGNADVTYHFRPAGGIRGYLLGGIGVYSVQLALTSVGATGEGSETRFTWDVGGGFVYGNDSTALFVEARYVAIAPFGRLKATFLPFTAGIRTGGK